MARVGSIRFWLSFLFLNSALALHLPGQASAWSYLEPSLDVIGLCLTFVLLAAWRKRVPRPIGWAVLGYLVASFALGMADGIEQGAYRRNFVLAVDLPLLPEFVRLFHATQPWPLFLATCSLIVALGVGLFFAFQHALRLALTELESPALGRALCVGVGALALLAAVEPAKVIFQPSRLPRWIAEIRGLYQLPRLRVRERLRIAAADRALQARPRDLTALRGQNVYVFLIESYGQSALERPELYERIAPEYRSFERELSGAGFQIASRVLDSPVYGGRSWLAQASLLTGIVTRDQLQFELLRQAQPHTVARAFSAAGYRSVLIQPGTVRADSERDLLRFDQRYTASDLGYRGPRYGWATMPDQFVIDAVRRRELSGTPARPLFLTYALVSSHIPWSALPPLVADWNAIGDGSSFERLQKKTYATSWLTLTSAEASAAYADAIAYDLAVLRHYLLEFVKDDSLVIVLGDHQPHGDITLGAASFGVPVHVLSRRAAFVARFGARGYTPGMVADEALPHPGLESLLPDLLADFSQPAAPRVR